MKVGILVYSKTGHTEEVAKKTMELLNKKGYETDFLKIETEGEVEGKITDVKFKSLPDLAPYDAIVCCSYVEAFSLCQVMSIYLNKINDLKGKKAVCFVTQHLMHKWMGGTRALKQMRGLLEAKGANVLGTEDVNWKKEEGRQDRIISAAKNLSNLL